MTGADAHVWPQVYLGPDAGWVSVEPTPPATPAAVGVLVARRRRPGPRRRPPRPSTPRRHRVARTTATTPGSHGPGRASVERIPAAVVGVLVLAAPRWWCWPPPGARRRRRRPAPDPISGWCGPGSTRWWRCAAGASRTGRGRRRASTPAGCSRRRALDGEPVEAEAVAELAALVELACYTSGPCSPGAGGRGPRSRPRRSWREPASPPRRPRATPHEAPTSGV